MLRQKLWLGCLWQTPVLVGFNHSDLFTARIIWQGLRRFPDSKRGEFIYRCPAVFNLPLPSLSLVESR